MTKLLELYKCEICGNIVQVMHKGVGELVCCGKPMVKLEPHTTSEEMSNEKHIPIFTDDNRIQVGSVPHPMLKEHYIEFIQCLSIDKRHIETKFLRADEKPEMEIFCKENYETAREYCNIHGLWEN